MYKCEEKPPSQHPKEFDMANHDRPHSEAPPGIVPGNFQATVFLTIDNAIIAIADHLRGIEVLDHRAFEYTMISADLVHRLSNGGLEEDNEWKVLLGHSLRLLHKHMDLFVAALQEIEVGLPRYMMYGSAMGIVAGLSFSLLRA